MTINVIKTPYFLRLYTYYDLGNYPICYMKFTIKILP